MKMMQLLWLLNACDLTMQAALYLFLEFLLVLPDPGDLWVRVDDGRHAVVVDVRDSATDPLHAHDPLVLRLVREHRPVDTVSDSVDTVKTQPLDKTLALGYSDRVDTETKHLSHTQIQMDWFLGTTPAILLLFHFFPRLCSPFSHRKITTLLLWSWL